MRLGRTGGRWWRRRAPAPAAGRSAARRSAGPGLADDVSMWAPGSRRRSADDSAWVTRQPVTTSSFCGSPGRNSLRGRSSVGLTHEAGRGAQRVGGAVPSGATEKVATSTLPEPPGHAGRSRPPPPPPVSALSKSRLRHEQGRQARHHGRPSAARGRVRRRAGRARRRSSRRSRRGAPQSAAALVGLCGRPVDLEPPHAAAAEPQGAAVVARAEEHHLGRAVAEARGATSASITWVRCASADARPRGTRTPPATAR